MKTLTSLTLLAAFVAFLVFPVNFEFTVAMLFIVGLAALLVAEYSRPARLRGKPVRVSDSTVLVDRSASALRLAA